MAARWQGVNTLINMQPSSAEQITWTWNLHAKLNLVCHSASKSIRFARPTAITNWQQSPRWRKSSWCSSITNIDHRSKINFIFLGFAAENMRSSNYGSRAEPRLRRARLRARRELFARPDKGEELASFPCPVELFCPSTSKMRCSTAGKIIIICSLWDFLTIPRSSFLYFFFQCERASVSRKKICAVESLPAPVAFSNYFFSQRKRTFTKFIPKWEV